MSASGRKKRRNNWIAKGEWYILLLFSKGLASVPLAWVHQLSDLIRWLAFDLMGFRKKVILENLRNSFPNHSYDKNLEIHRDFSRYFCDMMLETIRAHSMSNEELGRQVEVKNLEVVDSYFDQRRNVAIALGHYSNWEWAGPYGGTLTRHRPYVIYHPLGSFGFNRLLYQSRRKRKWTMMKMKRAFRKMQILSDEMQAHTQREPYAVAFLADQNAPAHNAYWTRFLNQETAFFWGLERAAKKFDLAVIYARITQPRRGHYLLEFEPLVDQPSDLPEGKIIEKFAHRLEQQILEYPPHWLWSHRRWKAKRPSLSEAPAHNSLQET